jgi:hypothetical protein
MGDDRLSQLLPFGSTETVRRRLPELSPLFGAQDWARIARLHPDIAFEAIHQRTQAQTEPDARLRSDANAVLVELADSHPDDALTLVRDLLRYEPPIRLRLQRLAERRTNDVVDLLLAQEDGGSANVSLAHFAHRLSPERLLAVLRYRPNLLPQPHVWLHRLPPDVRRAAWEQVGLSWRNTEGVVSGEVIALLPADLREKEARRHLALPALATRPAQRLPYATFLPWEEAVAALTPSIRNPDADLRAAALSALIGATRFQPQRLPDALSFIRSRANEQDPVRRAMLAALATLPPSRWKEEHLDDLSQIIQDALNAADLSHATASEAERLVVSLVPFHPEWSASWLGTLVKSRGQAHFYGLENRLTDEDVKRIAPALLPLLKAWETRERERFLIHVAYGLGRRLRVFDGLVDILEGALQTTLQGYVASHILNLFASHRPERLAALIPALLESDPSAITLPAVYEYLHRRRQDLLTPFLGQQAYTGRFSTGRTRFVLPMTRGFHRWTPSQQTTFSEILNQVTQDSARDTPSIARVISQLAALPAVYPARLIELADRGMENMAVRDAALRALARLDAGQGIPILVEALGDLRARVAIYALRSAILEMPADRALALLGNVPTEKVTVAKEVVRLLGELNTPDVYPILLEMDGRPLHRDVRVALLRALWDHIERDETWAVLNRAAADPDPTVAAGVVRIPTDRLSPLAQRRLLHLMTVLLNHADAKVRLNTLERCIDLPLPDPGRTLLPPLLARLASPLPDETAVAARAVFATYAGSAGQDAAAIGETVARVHGDRRVLLAVLRALQSALMGDRARLRPAVWAVLGALAGDPLTVRYRVELAITGLLWQEVAQYLAGLGQSNELHPEALMAAVRAIEESEYRSASRANYSAEAVAEPAQQTGLNLLEAVLADSPDERLRRLALAALVAQAGGSSGWTEELRARLDRYQQDPAPLVAAAAQFTFPPPDSAS